MSTIISRLAGDYDLRRYDGVNVTDERTELCLGGLDCQAKLDALIGVEMVAQQHLAGPY